MMIQQTRRGRLTAGEKIVGIVGFLGVAFVYFNTVTATVAVIIVIVIQVKVEFVENRLGVPAVVFDQVNELNNELALFVLLTRLERLLVLPANGGLARLTVDVGHGVQAREQIALLGRSRGHVDHFVKQIRSALTALKRLGYQVVMVG